MYLELKENFLIHSTMKPIVKWSGGKSDELLQIKKHIPEVFDTYIEPFIGGGSLFFDIEPKKSVISDVHTELIDLYSCIKKGLGVDIKMWMDSHPNDEETYYKVRDKFVVENSLDNACRFFYQRKTCFRGMMRYNKNGKFNIPFGRYKTYNYSEIESQKYIDIFKNCQILNSSFEEVMEKNNSPENFCFLDPPYDSPFTDYGYCKFGKDEHIKLAEIFKKTKMKCLMVIGKTDFITDLYSGYISEEYPKKYRFKIHSGRVGDEINKMHLVIKNYT